MKPKQCQVMCPGCPAEKVTQNIAAHRELDPNSSGATLFTVLVSRMYGPHGANGLIGSAIQEGATTPEAIKEKLDGSAWAEPLPGIERYGDLSHEEIIEAAIGCMLREARDECTLEAHHRQLAG